MIIIILLLCRLILIFTNDNIVVRLSSNSLPNVVWISFDCRLFVIRLPFDCRPTVVRLSSDFRSIVVRQSDCRLTVGWLSSRVVQRYDYCRMTGPTVNRCISYLSCTRHGIRVGRTNISWNSGHFVIWIDWRGVQRCNQTSVMRCVTVYDTGHVEFLSRSEGTSLGQILITRPQIHPNIEQFERMAYFSSRYLFDWYYRQSLELVNPYRIDWTDQAIRKIVWHHQSIHKIA